MPKLTPNNSRSAQMMTRAAGKGFLTSEDEAEPQTTPEGPRFDSLVEYPHEAKPADEKHREPDSDEIDRKLDAVPPEPGVYLLKDKSAKVLYVGKAKSLRSRVRAYFR